MSDRTSALAPVITPPTTEGMKITDTRVLRRQELTERGYKHEMMQASEVVALGHYLDLLTDTTIVPTENWKPQAQRLVTTVQEQAAALEEATATVRRLIGRVAELRQGAADDPRDRFILPASTEASVVEELMGVARAYKLVSDMVNPSDVLLDLRLVSSGRVLKAYPKGKLNLEELPTLASAIQSLRKLSSGRDSYENTDGAITLSYWGGTLLDFTISKGVLWPSST